MTFDPCVCEIAKNAKQKDINRLCKGFQRLYMSSVKIILMEEKNNLIVGTFIPHFKLNPDSLEVFHMND